MGMNPLHETSSCFETRVTPRLTLNYGLRYEVTTPWYEAQGQLETIVPGLQSKIFPGSPTGWVFPGDPGIPKTLAPVRHNNFAPRVVRNFLYRV